MPTKGTVFTNVAKCRCLKADAPKETGLLSDAQEGAVTTCVPDDLPPGDTTRTNTQRDRKREGPSAYQPEGAQCVTVSMTFTEDTEDRAPRGAGQRRAAEGVKFSFTCSLQG